MRVCVEYVIGLAYLPDYVDMLLNWYLPACLQL